MRIDKETLRKLQHKHPSPSKQAAIIEHLENVLEVVSPNDPEGGSVAMNNIYEECGKMHGLSTSTIRTYWKSYLLLGELPYETKLREKKLRKKYNWLPKNSKITVDELDILNDIVTHNPLLYLDEIAVQFGFRTNKYFLPSTIWRYLTRYLALSLKILRKRAEQQCAIDEHMFKQALQVLLQNDPERLILVDETHKDRNTARRKKGWGRRNTRGAETILTEWYKCSVRYTLIAAADINGFIECACDTLRRDVIDHNDTNTRKAMTNLLEVDQPSTGASGTVDGEYFVQWVRKKLCPVLGNYERGEPRSVVVLDNASIHHSDEVVDLIHATGAVIIYSAPYSPTLNPIENYFSMYKKYLKNLGEVAFQEFNWDTSHTAALGSVTRDNGIRYYRSCGIPGAWNVRTTDEIIYK